MQRKSCHAELALWKTLGEPDFDTPKFIQDAATTAMAEGFTHYSQVAGLPELRAAIAAKLAADSSVFVTPQPPGCAAFPAPREPLVVAP